MLIHPQSRLRNKWAALIVLLVILLGLAIIGYVRERYANGVVLADRDAAILESANLQRMLTVKPNEVVKIVEKQVPKEVIRLVKEHVLVPVASGTITGEAQPVNIPLTNLEPSVEQVEVNVGLTGWFLMTRAPGGTFGYDGGYTVELTSGGWNDSRTFDRTNTTIDIRVSEDITNSLIAHAAEKRIGLAVRPVSQWRTGWVVGAGLSYDPFSQRMAPAVFGGYALQF